MQAPSAANQRPREFYVVKNKELLSLLSGVSSYGGYVEGEPLAIVICFKEGELKFPEYVPFDCACAAMNIRLCAEGLVPCGPVSCPSLTAWGGWAKFQICPPLRRPFCIMPIGFASGKFASKILKRSRFEPERIHFL